MTESYLSSNQYPPYSPPEVTTDCNINSKVTGSDEELAATEKTFVVVTLCSEVSFLI